MVPAVMVCGPQVKHLATHPYVRYAILDTVVEAVTCAASGHLEDPDPVRDRGRGGICAPHFQDDKTRLGLLLRQVREGDYWPQPGWVSRPGVFQSVVPKMEVGKRDVKARELPVILAAVGFRYRSTGDGLTRT